MRRRVCRVLLACLPRAFRAEFGDDMLATAAALDRARPVRLHQGPRIVADAVMTSFTIRRELRAEARPPASTVRSTVMEGWWQDVRVSLRGLGRDPSFTVFIIAALTLGIGSSAAMFGIVDHLLLSGPPHVRDESRVVRAYLTTQPKGMQQFTTDTFGYVSYALLRPADRFEDIAAYAINQVVAGQGTDAREAQAGYASDTLFALLGVTPAVGRFFDADENRPSGAAHVAVLGYGAWQQWFGGRRDIVGRDVTIGAEPYAIVGVAPKGFTGPQFGPVDVWMPLNLTGPRTTPDWQTSWDAQWLQIVGRLKPHVTAAQAGAELTALHRRGYTGDEDYVAAGRFTVAALSASDTGVEAPEVTVVRWLSGVAILVLVIACANVANLLLARGLGRAREVGLRAALGAERWRLVRLLLVESFLLSGAGALGGLGVAYVLGDLARGLIFAWVDWETPVVDGRIVLAAALLALATGLVIGLLPAWRATSGMLTTALKAGRGGSGQRSRVRHGLTIVQAALSVVLLVGAGLFLRSLWNASTLPLGFDPDRVLVIELSRAPLGQIPDGPLRDAARAERRRFAEHVLPALSAIPGVAHVSLAVGTPFGNRFTVAIRIPGVPVVPRLTSGGPSVSAVSDGYFATVGTRIVRGRPFGPGDRAGSEPVAIVSDTMARTVWPSRDPIGQCLIVGAEPAPCARIVGIAEDTHRSALREPPVMHYYIPFGQERGIGGTAMLVRAAGDPTALGPRVTRTLMARDSSIRFVYLSTIRDAIDPETRPLRIGAIVLTFAGLIALVVAAIGLHSVMSYLVADRTREIGVRLALGAGRGDIARVILQTSVGMAAIGVIAGAAVAAAAAHVAEPLLFHESSRDPRVYALVAGLLMAIACLSGVVPAIRANRIDPLEALRAE